MIMTAFLLVSLSYLGLTHLNKFRYEDYLAETLGGTFSLITAGIHRHKDSDRHSWLAAVERLSGLPLTIGQLSSVDHFRRYVLSNSDQVIYLSTDLRTKHTRVAIPVPGVKDRYVLSELKDINQSVTRASAIFVLNELGRHPKERREGVLNSLNELFGYELSLMRPSQLPLDASQRRQLSKGEIVVNLSGTSSNIPFIQVYAAYGNSGKILVIGPIQIFQWYPVSILSALVLFGLALLFALGYLLVYPLERKLELLETGINQIETLQPQPILISGSNAFSKIATSINDMALRINSLVLQQRQLTNDISHELRTPVARMIFRLDSLEGSQKMVDRNAAVGGLRRDIGNLNVLIDELLTSATIDSMQSKNGAHFETEKIDIVALATELITDLSAQFQEIDVRTFIQNTAILVMGDEKLLRRALENLLLNASRYCKSSICLSLAHSDAGITLSIEDDGPGVPEENREAIFSPFVRVDKSRQRADGGFGLGLSIVYKIAVLHKGTVGVDDSELMGGAKFSLMIPSSLA